MTEEQQEQLRLAMITVLAAYIPELEAEGKEESAMACRDLLRKLMANPPVKPLVKPTAVSYVKPMLNP